MPQAFTSESFENALSSHIEMCYAVAVALTRDPVTASQLTRDVITSAWHHRQRAAQATSIKKWLLTTLRETFLERFQGNPEAPKDTFATHQAIPGKFMRLAVPAAV